MPGMTKREAKNLANAFANLRPGANSIGHGELLWRDMINATAEHLPSNIANAFINAATNHGIWQKIYEE